jgi:hypothetical protein
VGIRSFLGLIATLTLAGCPGNAAVPDDAGAGRDGSAVGDGDGDADGDGECDGPGEGCTCVEAGGGASCTHSFGGVYGDGACSASYQCCDGVFVEGTGPCGPCVCTEPTGELGCSGPDETECFPSFDSSAVAIPEEVRDEMTGTSWHPELDCPAFEDLRLLTVGHWRFDGTIGSGELVVAASATDKIAEVFRRLYDARFPIARIERVDLFGGDDDASMAANNTSAFNCRRVTGGTRLSDHSFGTAIDINPIQNPYVSGGTVLPSAGSEYLDRSNVRPGMIVAGDEATRAFADIGWGWGGNFSSIKDYQHFSASGN